MSQAVFPEIQERNGCLHSQAQDSWVSYSRRVLLGWSSVIFAITLVNAVARGSVELPQALVGLGTVLILMTLFRRAALGTWAERPLSAVGLTLVIPAAAFVAKAVPGFPWWSFSLAAVAVVMYVCFCGRDMSFAGMAVLGSVACAITTLVAIWCDAIPHQQGLWGWLLASTILAYISYDMAMILRRRVAGEEVSGVADLFRDLLNWVTYPFRIALHWKRYRFDPFPGGGR